MQEAQEHLGEILALVDRLTPQPAKNGAKSSV
jgi:hypothetical protein